VAKSNTPSNCSRGRPQRRETSSWSLLPRQRDVAIHYGFRHTTGEPSRKCPKLTIQDQDNTPQGAPKAKGPDIGFVNEVVFANAGQSALVIANTAGTAIVSTVIHTSVYLASPLAHGQYPETRVARNTMKRRRPKRCPVVRSTQNIEDAQTRQGYRVQRHSFSPTTCAYRGGRWAVWGTTRICGTWSRTPGKSLEQCSAYSVTKMLHSHNSRLWIQKVVPVRDLGRARKKGED
jgi:hypothetical protein